jgi:hypothetical protein
MTRDDRAVESRFGEALFVSSGLRAIGGLIGATLTGLVLLRDPEVVFWGLAAAVPGAVVGMVAGTPIGVLFNKVLGRVLAVTAGALCGVGLALLLSAFGGGLGA